MLLQVYFVLSIGIFIVYAWYGTANMSSINENSNMDDLDRYKIEQILSWGKSKMDKQKQTNLKDKSIESDTIFLLGMAGSGKTTAALYIAGHLDKLKAEEQFDDVIVTDKDNLIGLETTSKTLVPNHFVQKETGTQVLDGAGFNENRGSKQDIVAMYLTKYALDNTHRAKILITVTQDYLKIGERTNFPLLMKYVVELFKDVKQFKNSIGLLVTRVGGVHPVTKKELSDDELLQKFTRFLNKYLDELQKEEYRFCENNMEQELANTNIAIQVVKGILEGQENGNQKIFLFRSPSEYGEFSSIPSMIEMRNSIASKLNDLLSYAQIPPNSFRYTVRDSTKRDIENIFIPEIEKEIAAAVQLKISELSTNYFNHYDASMSNKQDVSADLERDYKATNKFLDRKNRLDGETILSDQLANLHTELLSDSNSFNGEVLLDLEERLDFFSEMVFGKADKGILRQGWAAPVEMMRSKIVQFLKIFKFGKNLEQLFTTRKLHSVKVFLRKHKDFVLDTENVFGFLENAGVTHIEEEIKNFWANHASSLCKQNFVELVKNLLPQKYPCKPIPPNNEDKFPTEHVDLQQIVDEGIAKMNEQFLHACKEEERKAIFLFGITGTGKSTSAQIVAGDLENLYATTKDNTLVIIDKDQTIGEPRTTSRTLLPNILTNRSSSGTCVWVLDCPGFDDTRGTKTDIAAMNFLNHALELADLAMFIFTVPESSVTIGNDKKGFDELAKHVITLMKNIEYMQQSIGLLVTKVVSYKDFDYIPDNEILDRTVGFLQMYKLEKQALLQTTANENELKELENKIAFVEGLLNQGGIPRISIIRSPSDCGPLNTMEEMCESKTNAQNLCNDVLQYTPIKPDNFKITLSAESLYEVVNSIGPEILKTIEKSTEEILKDFSTELHSKFHNSLSTENPLDSNFFGEHHLALRNILAETSNNGADAQALYAQTLLKISESLNCEMNSAKHNLISSLEKQYGFYQSVAGEGSRLPKQVPSENFHFKSLSDELSEFQEYYSFCESTENQLLEYEAQKRLKDLSKSQLNTHEILSFLESNNLVQVGERAKYLWNKVNLQDKKYLVEIVSKCFPDTLFEFQHNSSTLLVSGKTVFVSHVNAWRQQNSGHRVRSLKVVAAYTIHQDADSYEKGNELKLYMIAPVLNVITFEDGQMRRIVLDGLNAKPLEPREIGIGKDGRPGNPGGNAGSFLGIFGKINNWEKLSVSAIGGNGGPGECGAPGKDGRDGRDAAPNKRESHSISTRDIPSPARLLNGEWDETENRVVYEYKIGLSTYYRQETTVMGEEGEKGGNGGKGGDGGASGLGGSVKLVCLYANQINCGVKVITKPGEPGDPGKGGMGGKGGKNGDPYIIESYTMSDHLIGHWSRTFRRADDGKKGDCGKKPKADTSAEVFESWDLPVLYKQLHSENLQDVPKFLSELENVIKKNKFL